MFDRFLYYLQLFLIVLLFLVVVCLAILPGMWYLIANGANYR